jgi:hypothetical protein
MAVLDLTGPTVDLVGNAGDLKLVTVRTRIASAATDVWVALARPRTDRGTIIEWQVDKSGAGTTPYPVVVEADFADMAPGLWVWCLFRNGLPFWQASKATVRGVIPVEGVGS